MYARGKKEWTVRERKDWNECWIMGWGIKNGRKPDTAGEKGSGGNEE